MFTPINIGKLEIPNRLARSATAERAADEKGRVTEPLLAMYKALAAGGTGSIMTGHAYIHPHGRTNYGMTGVHCDDMIPGLEKLTKTVHKNSDAKVFLQINHAGRVTTKELIGTTPAGPSAVPVKMSGQDARELSSDEIEELIEIYVQAALRGQEAGFDGVQIHCAHGYLISQFLSGYTNRREDQWGGSPHNRRHFLFKIIEGIQAKAAGFPLTVKINSQDFVTGGVIIEEFVETCNLLQEAGIVAIEVSGGIPEGGNKSVRKGINKPEKEAYFAQACRVLKDAGITIPVIAVGGFRSYEVCQDTLDKLDADIISLCRPLITEPDLPLRWKNGNMEKSRCISCNMCLKEPKEMTHCVHWANKKDK